jgi:transposase
MIFVGCDWSRFRHDVVILDQEGAVRCEFSVLHAAGTLAALAEQIAALESDPTQVRVGIELHDGALLAWLLDQGYTVYGLNPKSAERARDRYRPSGGKDDRSDAFILADVVRTDRGHLRPIGPASETTQALHGWVRFRARQVHERTATAQRLRALLAEWCPALSALCNDLNRQWQRDLLQTFPLHAELSAAHGNCLRVFARKHRLRSATYERLLAARSQEPLLIPAGRLPALRAEILSLVERLDQLVRSVAEIEAELHRLVADHPDAVVFESLPAHGTATIATLLAAFGEDREGAPSWRALAARWGVAPVTVQSGRARHVKRRRACDHTVNQAFLFFALRTAFTPGCWAADFYQAKRRNGVDHYAALRCLAQRWVKIIHRLWTDRLPYDEQIHQTNRQRHTGIAA